MPTDLFAHLLLIAAMLCAASLVRLLRGGDGVGRGYAFVVGALLIGAVMAMGTGPFMAVVMLGLIAATVVLPWLLEQGARAAFARGRLVWVARMSSLRASLMPGSGLARQLPILEALAMLERDGVDVALLHLRRLADEADDGAELSVIHEQIIAMLFYGQRWDEGIAHYERRFAPGYAALRPSLALGLLRAYGESGRLETAAGLLRELEDGPIGADPNAARVLSQARLTFLAYAGAVGPVDELARARRFGDLGLSAATVELFRGIALTRAGAPRQAVETLRKVEALAGPRDHRALEAAQALLERVRTVLRSAADEVEASGAGSGSGSGSGFELGELGPELRLYVELVADRMRELLLELPNVRARSRPRMTYAVIAVLALVYGVHLLRGGGGMGLLELGALSEDLWRADGPRWPRILTAAWIHVDLVGLLFDAYAIWLAGQIVERLLGPARMALVTVGAAIAGMAMSVLALPWLWRHGFHALAQVGATGGSLMAVGAITAALWCLLPGRTPALAAKGRRNLVVTLSLLLVANVLLSWPGAIGFGVAPLGLATCVGVASVITLLPAKLPRAVQRALALVVALLLAGNVAAAVLIQPAAGGVDPQAFLLDHRVQRCELDVARLHTPIYFSLASQLPIAPLIDEPGVSAEARQHAELFPLPILPGLIDDLELRDGSLVQVASYRGPVSEAPALLTMVEGLEHALSVTAVGPLPEPLAAALAADDGSHWRAFDLWQNGERVGRVVEHVLTEPAGAAQVDSNAGDADHGQGAPQPVTVMVVAAPAEALEHAPELYAAILHDATPLDASTDPDGGGDSAGRRPRCTVE